MSYALLLSQSRHKALGSHEGLLLQVLQYVPYPP